MPVVTLYIDRLQKMLGSSLNLDKLVDRIPHLGVDIEERSEEYLRVEYNPNRPDFSTDYGIVRALKGLLQIEVGRPDYVVQGGNTSLLVEPSVLKVRPHIVCMEAKGLELDEESFRQLISMQEDLHNGIGRKRRKVSIGIHDLDHIKPPLKYTTSDKQFEFTPLGSSTKMSIGQILQGTEQGITYGSIINGSEGYPLIIDSTGQTLSIPPIINSETTKLTENTKNLFMEITATDLSAAQDALMVIATTLHDAGSSISSVKISYPESELVTPNLAPNKRSLSKGEVNRLLGINLSEIEIVECLNRTRFEANIEDDHEGFNVLMPPYRVDILHEVDLVEEVALGYGIERMAPILPKTDLVGARIGHEKELDVIREIAVGLGLIETMNFSLIGTDLLDDLGDEGNNLLSIKGSKSAAHSILRGLLIPSLLSVLKRNIHEEYSQKIFEVAPVFQKDGSNENMVREDPHLAVALAHSKANFSEAKSYLTSVLSTYANLEFQTSAIESNLFIKGRGGAISAGGR
ncbi:MAG: phenylalanine--tRNA ligase subunit beta, partial [Nitrososphaerales archaeon]